MSFGLTLFNDAAWRMPGFFDDNSVNPIGGSLQRPAHIAWELEGAAKRIHFTWDHPLHHYGLTYQLRPQNKADRLAGQLPVGEHFWLE
jgi:hypothetical protein